ERERRRNDSQSKATTGETLTESNTTQATLQILYPREHTLEVQKISVTILANEDNDKNQEYNCYKRKKIALNTTANLLTH
ncbi:8856_t:CDS:2, partial [Racocetra persica]